MSYSCLQKDLHLKGDHQYLHDYDFVKNTHNENISKARLNVTGLFGDNAQSKGHPAEPVDKPPCFDRFMTA